LPQGWRTLKQCGARPGPSDFPDRDDPDRYWRAGKGAGEAVNLLNTLGIIACVVAIGYMLVVLFRPEKF
jgi:hypothetical protein